MKNISSLPHVVIIGAGFGGLRAAQALKDARATPAEIAELIGHGQGFTLETYAPMELPLPALQELVERIQYEGLQLNHLYV